MEISVYFGYEPRTKNVVNGVIFNVPWITNMVIFANFSMNREPQKYHILAMFG